MLDELKRNKILLILKNLFAQNLMEEFNLVSLRDLKTEFFRLKMDLKKKESDMSDKALPDWVKVGKKRFDQIKNEV